MRIIIPLHSVNFTTINDLCVCVCVCVRMCDILSAGYSGHFVTIVYKLLYRSEL